MKSYAFQQANPRMQPIDLLVKVAVHRVDPQLDLVGARRVPAIPEITSNSSTGFDRIRGKNRRNRTKEGTNWATRDLEDRRRRTWTEAARSRTSGSPSRAGEQVTYGSFSRELSRAWWFGSSGGARGLRREGGDGKSGGDDVAASRGKWRGTGEGRKGKDKTRTAKRKCANEL
jgi:hypothetical protein